MAQTRQSRPDSGLGLQVKALIFLVVPSSLGSGTHLADGFAKALVDYPHVGVLRVYLNQCFN